MLKLLTLFLVGQSLPLIPGLTLREQASFLLYEPPVRRALSLSLGQSSSVDAAERAYESRKAGLAKGSPTDAQLASNDRQYAADAVADLTTAQRRKLFLRAVQGRGVAALADPEVAAEVHLGGDAMRVRAQVATMDKRDGDVPEEVANAMLKLPEPKTPAEEKGYAAQRLAIRQAAEPRERARALARRKEEAALLASLPSSVRVAWAKLSK